jgi:hypothetical protein
MNPAGPQVKPVKNKTGVFYARVLKEAFFFTREAVEPAISIVRIGFF